MSEQEDLKNKAQIFLPTHSRELCLAVLKLALPLLPSLKTETLKAYRKLMNKLSTMKPEDGNLAGLMSMLEKSVPLPSWLNSEKDLKNFEDEGKQYISEGFHDLMSEFPEDENPKALFALIAVFFS